MFGDPVQYIPSTPPLRLRVKPTKSKKKLSRTTKEQGELLFRKYGNGCNNQLGELRPVAPSHDNNEDNDSCRTLQTMPYDVAATKIQLAWRCHFSRELKSRLQAQVGRPAQLQIHEIHVSDKWIRLGVYCIVTVLRRPYGPLMYQYKSEMTKTKMLSKQPPFFVPIMSSKYDVIVTVVAEPSKLQYPIFLGQAILHVEDWWTSFNQIQRVSFQTYRYPVDIQLQNSDRLLDGHVGLSVVSLNASMTSFSGQLAVRPNTVSKTLAAIKTRMGKLYVKNSLSYESSLSWCQNGPDIIQWGVLTETFLTVYNQGASVPCKNFDLRRIQLIHTTSPLHVKRHYLRIYYEGTIHTFGVDSSYDYGQWIYRIDANRRKLLVP